MARQRMVTIRVKIPITFEHDADAFTEQVERWLGRMLDALCEFAGIAQEDVSTEIGVDD